METHHQQTAATTMGVAEDETPSSLTSHPNPNVNNSNQEGTCQNCEVRGNKEDLPRLCAYTEIQINAKYNVRINEIREIRCYSYDQIIFESYSIEDISR